MRIKYFIQALLFGALACSAFAQEDFYFESKVTDESCSHCPEYLNLVKEVNKIVEKTPKNLSIRNENKVITEVSKLKFMYYETRSLQENGMVECNIFENQSPQHPSGLKRDELTLLAEEVLGIEKVKSFHIYPQGTNEELRYYYRDSDLESNIVIEVIVQKDHTAIVRYHHYNKQHNLPTLESHLALIEKDEDEGTLLRLGEDYKLHTQYDLKEDHQRIDLDVRDNVGEKYVKITSSHHESGAVDVNAVIPMEFVLNKKDELKISTEIGNKNNINYQTELNTGEAKVRMALTDMNHDYLDATVMSDYDMQKQLELRSKFKLGSTGHVEAKFNNDHLGQQYISLKSQVRVKETAVIDAGINQDAKGVEKLSLGSQLKLTDSASISTEFNKDSLGARDVGVGSSVQVGEKIKLDANLYTNDQGQENVRFSSDIALTKEVDLNGKISRNEKGVDTLSFGSRFNLGENGSLNTDYVEKYQAQDTHLRSVSVGHEMTTKTSSFTTSAGVDTNNKTAFKFEAQKRISENTSMTLSLEHAEDNVLLYQFQSKF